jgi:uncharacterized repeat protein (TIGR01451 family)
LAETAVFDPPGPGCPAGSGADAIDLMAGISQGGSMRRTLKVLATAVGMVLLVCGVAAADTVTTTFEPPTFHLGSVAGQDGWRSAVPGDVPALPFGYDQEVEANGAGVPAAFGQQSLRLSNRYTEPTGEFFYQTYSKPAAPPAGETQANTEFTAEFSFISKTPTAEQPGLNVSVSPDSGEGSRMSYVGLRDTPAGIRVTVFDTPEVDGEFVPYDAGILDRTVPHTIRFWIKVNPGVDNDLVRIYIGNRDLGQCFTTWENYYRTAPEQAPPPNVNTPATINSLQFRSSAPTFDGVDGGYLFDNVTITTANGPGPRGCDIVVDKDADTPTVSAGARAGYSISVRNRGRAIVRNVRVCDHIPRRMTFVSADRRLRRLGRLRCLMIPSLRPGQRVSFHLALQVSADAPQGTVTNIADIIHGIPGLPAGGEPGARPAPGAGLRPRVIAKIKAIVKARAIVRILKRVKAERVKARRGSTRPPFTG